MIWPLPGSNIVFQERISLNTLSSSHQFLFQLNKTGFGIYVVFAHNQIGRVKGASNILYIGQGIIKNRLISLLDPHFRETGRKHTAKYDLKRIIAEKQIDVFVDYCFFDTNEEAKENEKYLLEQYCKEHIEPPPLNHTRK